MWENNLRKIRKERGLSQFDLAKMADVNPTDISTIENCKKFPYPAWRRRLSAALEVPENEVFPGFAEVKQNDAR
jgi:putative transcriptional regulator